jgi:ATP-binding cassette subfamily B multidrug efflux pump
MSESNNRSSNHSTRPLGGGMGMPGRGSGIGTIPKVRPQNTSATIKKLWTYLQRQRIGLIIVYISTFLSAVVSLIGPYLIGRAIDDYIIPKEYNGLLWLCLMMVGIYIVGSIITWVQAYVMSGVSQRTVLELRHDIFEKYQQLPLKFFDTNNTGELMSRTTNDIENVSNSLNQSVIQLLTSVITLSGSLVIMLSLNLSLTLVSLITIPLVLFATRQIASLTRRYFKGQQKHLGELNGFIEETIQGQKVVKLYRRETIEIKKFKEINQQLNAMGTKAQIVSGLVGPVMNAVNNLNFALIAAIGGWMVFKDLTTVGIIVSFLNYSKQFGRPITELANQYNLIQSAVAGAERVFEILELESEYTEDEGAAILTHLRGTVAFNNVSFSYRQDTPILQQVSFIAQPGEKIALVGPTGAGKTTIVNLLTRFYDIDEGSITIDGLDIRQMDKNILRTNLGMVLQDAYVFSGSIRDNIRFGRLDATDEEVQTAAKLANADGFISRLPHGYDMILQAGGSNLSHGQRQLLTIARAILANPSVLILDEATSSVDTRTEMHIQEAMKNLMQGRTSFVIAHRLSTIQDADQILVMDGGRIIERGNHVQLLEARGFYYELYNSQFRRVV